MKRNKIHQMDVIIKPHIENEILPMLADYDTNQVLIVTDNRIERAYGALLNRLADYPRHVLKRQTTLVPDEKAVGEVMFALRESTGLILAVGSGVINDLCRFVSYQTNIPYAVVMSAPSMDGYASTGAAMMVDGYKKTFYCHMAQKLFGDTDVLMDAPLDLILAGLGDILGKVTALMDWQLAHIINAEYIDFDVLEDIYDGLDTLQEMLLVSESGLLASNDVIRNLSPDINKWLIRIGFHMSKVGNSRPASGMEHMMSHVMEMERLKVKNPLVHHGIMVGVSTLHVLRIYENIMLQMDTVKSVYDLNDEQVNAIIDLYCRGVKYRDFVEAYYSHIETFHDLAEEEILYALTNCHSVRDRFAATTVINRVRLPK